MPYTVLRVPSVRRTVDEEMSGRERRAYDAAVVALKGEGCRAAGKRLASIEAGDYPLCQRSLYGAWRMITAYPPNGTIVIVVVARHAGRENPIAALAQIFPGLSPIGRRRSHQPQCCEDPAKPPALTAELEGMLFDLFGL